ncbi:uncharacterized protein LOC106081965 [Stomoxys calcitrans]|uniref:uncharacterized protein LOC106081965 n=1 Tax=Stomoxys calcitrans TaxID=35570 RepID=UPI0027E25A2F|nr:uncharacterized protein LOC106081965 [Stomoxys calcitrans]
MKFISIVVLLVYSTFTKSSKVYSSHAGGYVKIHQRKISENKSLSCGSNSNNTCAEESFEPYCMGLNNRKLECINSWPSANFGDIVRSKDLCLLTTGQPLMRSCLYNSSDCSAYWEEFDVKAIRCLRDIKQNIVTNDLYQLLKRVQENPLTEDNARINVTSQLVELLKKSPTVRTTADLVLTADILELITEHAHNHSLVPKVLQVMNLLMASNDNVILSSSTLGATNRLIKITEDFYDRMISVASDCREVPDGYRHYLEKFLSIFYINILCTAKSGIAVYNGPSKKSMSSAQSHISDSTTNNYFRYLNKNEDLKSLASDTNFMAYFKLNYKFRAVLFKKSQQNSYILRISLYKSMQFFVDAKIRNKIPASVIFRISTPRVPEWFPAPTGELLLRPIPPNRPNLEGLFCAVWDLGNLDGMKNYTNVTHNGFNCTTSQVPSFVAVVEFRKNPMPAALKLPLLTVRQEYEVNKGTIAACIQSLLGLFCIFVTAIVFKEWRLQFVNQLLVNICLVLTLFTCYFIANFMTSIRKALQNVYNLQSCKIMGALLQYCILVLSVWMLFIGILQYYRYASVFGAQPRKCWVGRSALAAWTLPLIPTALVFFLDSESYTLFVRTPTAYKQILCYPTGLNWYLSVLLPFSLAICADLCIFAYIVWKIRISLTKFHRTLERNEVIMQVRKSFCLLLILSISWIFGILGHIHDSSNYSRIFCYTATLQGVFLFVYFVMCDENARASWLRILRARRKSFAVENTVDRSLSVTQQWFDLSFK